LRRCLELNPHLLAIGVTFVRQTTIAPVYRLGSIDDRYPAMLRVATGLLRFPDNPGAGHGGIRAAGHEAGIAGGRVDRD